jgi:hypothetical protein
VLIVGFAIWWSKSRKSELMVERADPSEPAREISSVT